jgi:hypothetical protein
MERENGDDHPALLTFFSTISGLNFAIHDFFL